MAIHLVVTFAAAASARRLRHGPMRPDRATAEWAGVVAALATLSPLVAFEEIEPLTLKAQVVNGAAPVLRQRVL
jgi:bifunctional ADP-heptose synthase (sugar kinase/adenylyltransferase)